MTTTNDDAANAPHAGPVSPDWRKVLAEPPLAIAGDLDQRWVAIQYGLQCWNACAEHVAGPLRQALSECAKAVGAGAAPDCSVEFLREVPREVGLVVAKLRERVAELEQENAVLAESIALGPGSEAVKSISDELDRLRAENEALRADLEWISVEWGGIRHDYAAWVLRRGGTGDLGDLRSFIDAARSTGQSKAEGDSNAHR